MWVRIWGKVGWNPIPYPICMAKRRHLLTYGKIDLCGELACTMRSLTSLVREIIPTALVRTCCMCARAGHHAQHMDDQPHLDTPHIGPLIGQSEQRHAW